MLNLKDMKYFSRDVGKGIKSTVHEYRWEFTIEDTDVCIQLFVYLISNLRKVVYNHEVLKEEHGGPNNSYSYEFIKDGHHYKIVQAMDNLTQLFIDGASFDFNYTLERNKKEFEVNNNFKVNNIFNNGDTDDIQASNEIEFIKNEKQNKKLNLSIGIKKSSSLNKKENNLNKFKFDSGENIKINKFNENQNNSNVKEINDNNLIDFDNDFNNDHNNNNFGYNEQNNNINNNYYNGNSYNDLNKINFNSNNEMNNNNYQYNNFNNQNTNNNNFNNSNYYNTNNINSEFSLNKNHTNNNMNNFNNIYNLEMNNNFNNFNINKNNGNYYNNIIIIIQ